MLRTLPRAVPRARLAQATRPTSLISFKAQPKAIRLYATAAAIPPSPRDSFASGSNQYYIEE